MALAPNQKIIRGGIGDILLALDCIDQEHEYIIFSHYQQALDLVAPYTTKAVFAPMQQPIAHIEGEVTSSNPYPNLKIPKRSLDKANKNISKGRIIIGLHPLGSKLSRFVDMNLQRPVKYMPPAFINSFISKIKEINSNIDILLFCAPDEVSMFSNHNVQVVAEENIWDCIAMVSKCNVIVGIDSAIKSISAILKIPTVVLIGDYIDSGRDRFIDPYKELKLVRFKNIQDALEQTLLEVKGLNIL